MKETTNQTEQSTPTEKLSFFKRIVNKIDSVMKDKAEKQSEQSSCCGPGDGKDKGGKCC